MGRPKKETVVVEDSVDDAIETPSGLGEFCVSGTEFNKREITVIPISPSLNFGLGGGIAEGSWVICSGIEKAGKSTTALCFGANMQRPEFGHRKVFYLDVEGRLKPLNLTSTNNLDLDRFFVVRSTPGNILNGEMMLMKGVEILMNNPGCLLIIDSSSALCSEKEMIGEIKAESRVAGPKLLAQFCRKMAHVVPINKCIVWVIQHMIANTSGFGSPFMEDGGHKIMYQADYKIRAKGFQPWKVGSEETSIGQVIDWQIVTSGLGGIPGTKVQSFLRFGTGLDVINEMIEMAVKVNLIVKKGAWFYFKDGKFQGQNRLWEYISSNPSIKDELGQTLNDYFKMAIYA